MKKLLLPLAVAAALPVSAFADVTVYGKANVSFQSSVKGKDTAVTEEDSYSELKSNASRIGVKGKHEISDSLKAIYKFEYETCIDDGDCKGQTFTQRNIYAGLEGGFGQVIAGNFDTPLKKAQKKVDLFNDLDGDIKNVITDNDKRKGNSVQYSTGKLMGDFKLAVDYINAEVDDNDVDNGVSAAFAWDTKPVYLAIAFDQNVRAQDADVVRLVGQFNFGAFQIGALYEMDTKSETGMDDAEVDSYMASVKWNLNKQWALKLQGGAAAGTECTVDSPAECNDTSDRDGTSVSLGADYKMAKNTKAFAFYTMHDYDTETEAVKTSGGNLSTFGVGLEVKF